MFLYTLSLTRSTLGLKIVIFRKFATELRPLIDVRIQLLFFNILRTNRLIGIVTRFFFPILKFYILVVDMVMFKGYYCALYTISLKRG